MNLGVNINTLCGDIEGSVIYFKGNIKYNEVKIFIGSLNWLPFLFYKI